MVVADAVVLAESDGQARGLLADFDPAAPPYGRAGPTPESARWLADFSASHGQAAEGQYGGKPGHSRLRDFARTYLAELARQPHRAMTAAAQAHNISRATANRWAAESRGLGYLPEKEN